MNFVKEKVNIKIGKIEYQVNIVVDQCKNEKEKQKAAKEFIKREFKIA